MNLTARLKKWVTENCDVKANAADSDFKKAVGAAIADGTLTAEKLAELSTTKEDNDADEFVSSIKTFTDSVAELKAMISDSKKASTDTDDDEAQECKDCGEELTDGKCTACTEKAAKKAAADKRVPSALEKMVTKMGGTPDDVDGEKDFDIRVKEAVDQYDDTKTTMTFPKSTAKGGDHPMAGRPVVDYTEPGRGRTLSTPSDRDKAVAGAFGQFLVASARYKSRNIAFQAMPQHSKELLCYAMQKMAWGGATDGGDLADIKGRPLSPHEQKALIDDSTSGGLEAAPIVFDDQVIQTPLLFGELYPLVTTVPLDRGRRIEGVAIGTVTGGWGGVDDTAISLFDTTSYVTAFDTTIFRWEGAVRIGLDFLSDTPIDFGMHLTSQYGERLLEDLDDVVAVGNGTTQPEGVMVKSGTTSIAFGGSTSLGNYESLRFGVAKAEHRANIASSAVFCGTETSYQRARALPVGGSDARRLGGTGAIGGVNDYGSYRWMGLPFKINESMANSQLFYCILARYRMYRRRGLVLRSSQEGDTLIRRNEMLLVAMARYGGQLERGAVAAVTSTAPA